MLFTEIYGSYYCVVSRALEEAVDQTLTAERLEEIIKEKAFAESILNIPAALESEEWPLLKEDFKTPLCHKPTMPLTTLQKRWMKAVLLDPRIGLFGVSDEGLEDVEPLYTQDVFVYFDRYTDSDPYENTSYREHFQCILTALREKRKLRICFKNDSESSHTYSCIPYKLEYSSKEDKFRLIAFVRMGKREISVARIQNCVLLEPYQEEETQRNLTQKGTLVLELVDERKTLERALLHFSHFEKETVRVDKNRYGITIHYDKHDEIELLNRVMAFGPMIQVLAPDSFLCLIRERLSKQKRVSF
jgi:hypothetical protein